MEMKFDEYKTIGAEKLATRAKLIRNNKEFAEKISDIKNAQKLRKKMHSKSQEDII